MCYHLKMSSMKGLLYSGGIESTYLLQKLEGTIQPVYVKFGFQWEKPELKVSRNNVKRTENSRDLIVINVEHEDPSRLRKSHLDKDEQYYTYIHGRTSSIITNSVIELNCMEINEFYEGTLGGGEDETFPDSTREFYDKLEETLSIGLNDEIKIRTPLIGNTKKDIIKEMRNMDIGVDDTISCVGNDKAEKCGECYKCNKRKKILKSVSEK